MPPLPRRWQAVGSPAFTATRQNSLEHLSNDALGGSAENFVNAGLGDAGATRPRRPSERSRKVEPVVIASCIAAVLFSGVALAFGGFHAWESDQSRRIRFLAGSLLFAALSLIAAFGAGYFVAR